MKKILIVISIICSIFLFSNLTNTENVSNSTPNKQNLNTSESITNLSSLSLNSKETINYNDGSYIVIELHSSNYKLLSANSSNKTGSRDVTKYDKNDKIEWNYTLTCYFSIVYGESSNCYNSTYSQYINDSSWKFSNGSTSTSQNTGYGYGTYKSKVLFITTKTMYIDISVSCDIYGNLY